MIHDHLINQPCHRDCPGHGEPSVTSYPCPDAGEPATPHLLTSQDGVEVCHYCGLAEGELRAQIVPMGTGGR